MYNAAKDCSSGKLMEIVIPVFEGSSQQRVEDMHQEKHMNRHDMWKHRLYKVCLPGIVCLVLACMEMVTGFAPIAHASGPGGNVSDPVVRAVDIAKPAVVRIFTLVVGQLTVNFSNGQSATFPLTPQQGFNGYPVQLSGTGAFISAHGDVLTADHVTNPVQDDKTALDQFLDQSAAPDIANYINQNLKPAQPVTADQVLQELVSGQLQSTSQYQKPESQVFVSTDFSGPINASSFQQVPRSQFATVDQIKESSPTNAMDLAIIHVSGMDNMPMLQLGDSSTVHQQDQLTIIGFPGNGDVNQTNPTDVLTSSINQILVSSIKTTPSGAPVIQVGGNVEHGDSGGPALDSNGQIVGVVSFGLSDTGGSTSFLQASNGAKQLMQEAGISTKPSPLQQAWNTAFTDYAANVPGHWHQSAREFQQISSQYPQFKAVAPFLQYANQQAQTETQTQESNSPGSNNTSGLSGGISPVPIIIGGIVVLIVVFGGVAISRRRKPAIAMVPPTAAYGVPSTPGYPGTPNQGYGAFPANAPVSQPQPGQNPSMIVPQTPSYPGQPPVHQQLSYVARPTQSQPQPGVLSPQPQPAYRPQPASPAPQPNYRPQLPAHPSASAASTMAAFGAPAVPAPVPMTPQPTNSASDATLVARPNVPDSQWRTWPCGHVNRYDASFCGTCGESAPPAPIVRRIEQ